MSKEYVMAIESSDSQALDDFVRDYKVFIGSPTWCYEEYKFLISPTERWGGGKYYHHQKKKKKHRELYFPKSKHLSDNLDCCFSFQEIILFVSAFLAGIKESREP